MPTVNFDTLKFVRTLEAAGVPSPQAEAISYAVRDAQDLSDLSTKSDLRELEQRMTIKLGSMLIVAVGAMAAIARLL
ncbi:DUF1640 domain-containing protein [Orrella sp. JC864]|uniref:DUF1640 domain-containing protein n=1 Tax=Orrella sp. JC864 TaxID=3120298 RepID=UPI0012BD6593